MAEPSTWIKLDRNILRWEWYTDANTMRVFIHLLLKANVKNGRFKNLTVKRGQVVTSYSKVALETGLSASCVRSSIAKLKKTGELSSVTLHDYSIITIENYDRYQDAPISQKESKPQKAKKPQTARPKSKDGATKTAAKEKSDRYLPKEWELNIPEQYWGRFPSEDKWWAYASEEGDEESAMS